MSATDPLQRLVVIDRLEMGPPRLDPQRLIAPYVVHQNGQTHTFEFSYRFEEDVFEPHEPLSANLGSMMAAQVALNYGLFCRQIVFRGSFDNCDRQFLHDMARNTATEIYVKKLLEHNPFLNESFPALGVVQRESYLHASLKFPDAPPSRSRCGSAPWGRDSRRICVLSSGGKESLLSFSLLRELGYEVHNVFINESGRHWFTALNAYRHFRANIPHTYRSWTNSDRMFSWMLRHLPFIRSDFGRLRSDEYPIRLWTVPVFLFGALPLMRKHGVGRLVVGDEYDTTDRRVHQGIVHYNGLYDQSRYFDHAISRYFRRKGYDVSQFSIVRPMSELLVEKVLIERYPELFQFQMSCHAAHRDDQRVRPCGHCEKCARVVSMLAALGSDPGICGYTQQQIDTCLENFARRGAMQEGPAQEHVAHLLSQRKRLPERVPPVMHPRRHDEIMKLRFDAKRSPVDDIPTDLRTSLYRTLLVHAEGAVNRAGRTWTDFDVLHSADLARPYRFESRRRPKEHMVSDSIDAKPTYLLGELTWPEAERRFQEVDIALLPVGAVEQHGPHLPLDTDAFDADCLSREVAASSSEPKPLVLPLIPYGVSYHHEDFSGTISIGPETLSRLVYEIGMSAVRNGITKLVIVNGHGGNVPALQFAAQQINRDAHIFTCVDSGETSDPDVEALAETNGDVHAGEIETSTSLANRPHLVQMSRAKKFVPKFSSHYLDFSSKRSVDWYARTAKISRTGVLGDPTKATRQKGEQMWQLMIDHLLALVEDLKRMSLDEIHQKSRI